MTVDSLTQQADGATDPQQGPAEDSSGNEATAPAADTDNTTESEHAAESKESAESAESTESTASSPKRGRQKGGSARKTRTVELTLSVTGTADGEWQAELKHGSKWIARGLEIPASAVSRAAKELHEELSTPIDEVINAAREQQEAKVAQLEAELERAKQALADLEG